MQKEGAAFYCRSSFGSDQSEVMTPRASLIEFSFPSLGLFSRIDSVPNSRRRRLGVGNTETTKTQRHQENRSQESLSWCLCVFVVSNVCHSQPSTPEAALQYSRYLDRHVRHRDLLLRCRWRYPEACGLAYLSYRAERLFRRHIE